ncbi:cytochrome c-type biogenesis protein CcmH [Gilvimarinus agarilyticus]|uniref:cytochrome c-type biogenesis protein n=1 Tax=unclassified Gilvimarinus TaxID=2642066 RepID=UPI001C0A297A|nr:MULTISPECIES: cytochrome c-type biogenesis protein [unclassified Gilvimarinus]MBU2887122.1 cytochrome c-type biogenesis protein CcmH [Gilvimarinus agarilyticus]MDO6571781.1 cytochrome c-type biogenesis protein CcmH [Gilvimarinus sp. 2_MG-2023]MDO6745854.1 cytochrome c-type biogenesis protein CcmH [Gilvimarinus sp. 1_MG-2023]
MRLALLFSLCWLSVLATAEQIYSFDDPVDRERFDQFNQELRCPQCQNQNVAGSDSLVAESLRQDLYEQILAGRSDKEIVDDMVRRYGNYILYKPPLEWKTAVLWLAPALLLVLGTLVLWRMVRRRQTAPTPLTDEDEAKIASMLAKYNKESQ